MCFDILTLIKAGIQKFSHHLSLRTVRGYIGVEFPVLLFTPKPMNLGDITPIPTPEKGFKVTVAAGVMNVSNLQPNQSTPIL